LLSRRYWSVSGHHSDGLGFVNLYSVATNQDAIISLFRVISRYVGNLSPMTGVFPDYPAPLVRNTQAGTELTMMRWGMPPPPRAGSAPVPLGLPATLRSCHAIKHALWSRKIRCWHHSRPIRPILTAG
jgi:putative SOS response-associated peptidase YedK